MSGAAEEVRALLLLGRDADAAERAEELLADDPEDVWLHLNAAVAFSRTGATDLADRSVEFALATLPDDPEVHRVASAVRQRLGDARAAFSLAERAVELAPDDVDAHLRLAFAGIGRRNRSGFLAARRAAERAVALAPDEAEPHDAMGLAHLACNAPKQAVEAHRAALERDPDNAVYHQHLAEALAKLGRRGEASAHLVAAGRADLGNSAPLARLRGLRKFGGLLAIIAVALVVAVTQSKAWNDSDSKPSTTTVAAEASADDGSDGAPAERWPVERIAVVCGIGVACFLASSARKWRLDADAARVLKQDATMRGRRVGRRRRS